MRWIGSHRGRISLVAARLGLAGFTASGALLLGTMPAHAYIIGPCTGHGYSMPRSAVKTGSPTVADAKAASSQAGGTTVDFKNQTVWHVPSWKDYLAGEGQADGAMSSGYAYVTFFGFDVQVAGGTGSNSTGHGGPISAYDIAHDHMPAPFKDEPPAKSLGGAGAAVPDPNGKPPASANCAGAIIVDFDDASAANTAVGQIAIGIMVISAAGIAAVVLRRV